MKSILIKICSAIGSVLLIIAGLFVTWFWGKSQGDKEGEARERNRQRDAAMKQIESNREIKDKTMHMTDKELHEMWDKDKRLQGDE